MPITAISGGADPPYLRAATALGATASLDKPFATKELTALVAKLPTAASEHCDRRPDTALPAAAFHPLMRR